MVRRASWRPSTIDEAAAFYQRTGAVFWDTLGDIKFREDDTVAWAKLAKLVADPLIKLYGEDGDVSWVTQRPEIVDVRARKYLQPGDDSGRVIERQVIVISMDLWPDMFVYMSTNFKPKSHYRGFLNNEDNILYAGPVSGYDPHEIFRKAEERADWLAEVGNMEVVRGEG